MDRDEIEAALEELGLELERLGVEGARLYLVGGAVMVLDFESREATEDIDGHIYPSDEVKLVAQQVGRRRGLNDEWLNDAAKACVPVFKEPEWRLFKTAGSLSIHLADSRSMLAMKIRASRGRRDEADLRVLMLECGITSEEDAVALFDEYFPDDALKPTARPMIRFALESEGGI